MPVVSAFRELGVLAALLGDLLPGERRLFEYNLEPDKDVPLPKDKMGEDSRDLFGAVEREAMDVLAVGVVGELMRVLLGN